MLVFVLRLNARIIMDFCDGGAKAKTKTPTHRVRKNKLNKSQSGFQKRRPLLCYLTESSITKRHTQN
jgi:hypothetical protein